MKIFIPIIASVEITRGRLYLPLSSFWFSWTLWLQHFSKLTNIELQHDLPVFISLLSEASYACVHAQLDSLAPFFRRPLLDHSIQMMKMTKFVIVFRRQSQCRQGVVCHQKLVVFVIRHHLKDFSKKSLCTWFRYFNFFR